MLALLFNRFPKRRLIGLLALGEWGPPTGAPVEVTGTLTSGQPLQESLLNGIVLNPAAEVEPGIGSGGGIGPGRRRFIPGPQKREIPEIVGVCSSEQKAQRSNLLGQLEFVGAAATLQTGRTDALSGNQESVGACQAEQGVQWSELVAHLHFIGRAATEESSQDDALLASLQFIGEAAEFQGTQQQCAEAQIELAGEVCNIQESQDGALLGEMIDVELEMIAALLIDAA